MRRIVVFPCEGETLLGTLDLAPGATGLLIVSGGNEPRMGAHRGMALLAGRLAAAGWPVFRFDRRGVGDSTGANRGWESSAPDLAAAAAAFRAQAPRIERIIGFGNCDAATALALFGWGIGIEDVILANPWLGDERDALPARAAIKRHYANRLWRLTTWWRLIRGNLDIRKTIAGFRKVLKPESARAGSLCSDVEQAMLNQDLNVVVVLATGDATAIKFDAATRGGAGLGGRYVRIRTDSHSFARADDSAALEAVILSELADLHSPARL